MYALKFSPPPPPPPSFSSACSFGLLFSIPNSLLRPCRCYKFTILEISSVATQQTFSCSKSAIETLVETGVKCVQNL